MTGYWSWTFFRWLLVVLLGALVLTKTNGAAASEGVEGISYPAANLSDDDYVAPKGYRLVWESNFEGEQIDPTQWTAQVEKAGRFNEEWQRYTSSADNAYIDQGCLVIKAIHESDEHGMDQYSSARLHTGGKHAWQYGRIAARMQLPYGEGMWPAFWTLGANIDENGGDTPWPQSGEIDIMEFYGSKNNGAIEVNIHYADKDDSHASMGATRWALDQGWFAERFHVFEVEWDAEQFVWYVDGREIHRTSIDEAIFNEFRAPHFILLNLAVGGKYSGRPDHTTQFPQYFYIDWVRVYQK
jgi:beta-glucanase (GH16 family)